MNEKQRIIEILNTSIEGISYIIKNLNTDYEFMSEICIQAINTVKNSFENAKKCDDRLYKLSNNILEKLKNLNKTKDTDKLDDCNKIINMINDMIDIINKNMKEKYNIVFMPYNASMWNSLESIWKEAKEDANFNCYVVPIPYYKLISNSNGDTDAIFTYEGDMLPKYVPITDYKTFDLEKINPDVIYIHNQYDEYNNATRVDSNYFSYNLKKYTDMLVYVTYGILGTYPISFYKDFYSFIGTREFDKVVVQSHVFADIAEYSGVAREKLLPLGSPKFDALVSSLKSNTTNEFYKNKFKGKKVFLWTTNLMKVINGRDKVLDEIEEVFNKIRKNLNYGLIYRPHPLELSYVKSKAPECYKRYKELLSSAKNTENIIIDNSPSYYEAFQISDALITDRSSVLIEYMATGKPVLIYDIGLNREFYHESVFDIFSNYIVGEEEMTVDEFIDLVVNEKDYKKDIRINALNTVLSNIDGSCGEKVHKHIKQYIENNYF